MNPVSAYLALGSNLGEREQHLIDAIGNIGRETGNITAVSSIYETAAKYVIDQPDFLNMVLVIETALTPIDLLIKCKEIEKRMGRDFTVKRFGPRVIDIDILFYGSEVIFYEDLVIPHPKIHERRFVLEPLYELNKKFVCPKSGKTINTLLRECKDQGRIEKISSSISVISR